MSTNRGDSRRKFVWVFDCSFNSWVTRLIPLHLFQHTAHWTPFTHFRISVSFSFEQQILNHKFHRLLIFFLSLFQSELGVKFTLWSNPWNGPLEISRIWLICSDVWISACARNGKRLSVAWNWPRESEQFCLASTNKLGGRLDMWHTARRPHSRLCVFACECVKN